MSNHTGTVSVKLTLTDLAEVLHTQGALPNGTWTISVIEITPELAAQGQSKQTKKQLKATIIVVRRSIKLYFLNEHREWGLFSHLGLILYVCIIWFIHQASAGLLYRSDVINDINHAGREWSLRSVSFQTTIQWNNEEVKGCFNRSYCLSGFFPLYLKGVFPSYRINCYTSAVQSVLLHLSSSGCNTAPPPAYAAFTWNQVDGGRRLVNITVKNKKSDGTEREDGKTKHTTSCCCMSYYLQRMELKILTNIFCD